MQILRTTLIAVGLMSFAACGGSDKGGETMPEDGTANPCGEAHDAANPCNPCGEAPANPCNPCGDW